MDICTFSEDFFDLSDFAKRLNEFIEIERHFVTGGLVIALDSKYGYGKTTFLTMWKDSLCGEASPDTGVQVISLNAWESDYYGDPLFAIVSSLIDLIPKDDRSDNCLVAAAKDVGWYTAAVGAQITKKFTGIDPAAAGKYAESKNGEVGEIGSHDSFSLYQGRESAMKGLQDAIRAFADSSESRLLFLVDELDRCRPDYAISYLETIKHVFDVEGAVFVLAADRQQLENSAKTAFGEGLDFNEYYRKFVHREVSLPAISSLGYGKIASAYATHYLERDGIRNCGMEVDSDRIKNISELIAALRLTPRQIQEVFRTLGHVLGTSIERQGRLVWCYSVAAIAMASFKIGNPRVYDLLGAGQLPLKEAAGYLEELLEKKYVDWWFVLFCSGGGLSVSKSMSIDDAMGKAGLARAGSQVNHGQWNSGWGNVYGEGFSKIHSKIEKLAEWG